MVFVCHLSVCHRKITQRKSHETLWVAALTTSHDPTMFSDFFKNGLSFSIDLTKQRD